MLSVSRDVRVDTRISRIPGRLRAGRVNLLGEVSVRRKASADGQAGKPDSDSEDYTSTERRLREIYFDTAKALENYGETVVQTAADRIATLTPPELATDAVMGQTRARMKEAVAEQTTDVDNAEEDVRRKKLALEAFKARNDIEREPSYSETPYLDLAVLFFLVTLETAINGLIFGDASEQGLVGGVFIAAGVSLLNVVILGYFIVGMAGIRLLRHIDVAARSIGAAIVAIGISFAAAINIAAAQYRDALELEQIGENPLLLVQELLRRWWVFETLPGIFLLILGVCFFAIAAWKGQSGIVDPYFHYRSTHRDWVKARRRRDDAREAMRLAAMDVVEDALGEHRKQQEQALKARKSAQALRRSAIARLKDANDNAISLRNRATRLIQTYREVNERSRETPPPSYFHKHEAFEIASVSSEPVTEAFEDFEKAREAFEAAFARLETELVEYAQDYLDEIDNRLTKIQKAAARRVDSEEQLRRAG